MSDLPQNKNTKLVEEIKIFIEYSVMEEERRAAISTVEELRENTVALSVMREFYGRLPEFRQEAITSVTRIVSRHHAYLIVVDTAHYQYLYFYNEEGPVFLGEKKEGIADTEVLSYFGYSSNEQFLKKTDDSRTLDEEREFFCPACGVAEGEEHLLGCPVEICPWCDSQFTYCNCRFDQLGVEEITEARELEHLEVILGEKGRIPFSADHAPGYPDGGEGEE